MTAAYQHPEALVSTDWLEANLSNPNLRVFDCSFYLHHQTGGGEPFRVESGRADYDAAHIPGAGFLDLQADFSDPTAPYRFTLPSPETTGQAFARHGIGDDSRVILYSRANMQRATRFWWMLRWLGFDNAAVLNGGIDKWEAEGRATTTAPCDYAPGSLTVRPRPELFVGKDGVLVAIGDPGTCTINALGPKLHSGEDASYGRAGRIPGSTNIPAASLLNSDLTFLPAETAAQMFEGIGATPNQKVITYCGGGIAATLDAFILYQLGYEDIAVYDNSMSEWVADPALPMETG